MSVIDLPKKTVDEWLNEVNYDEFNGYIPSEFALQYLTFIKLIHGKEGEENKSPVLHMHMLDKIAQGHPRIANLVFRGGAKTTVLAEILVLYLAVYGELPNFGKVRLALYVSDSMDNGVKNFRKNVEYRYDNSDFLKVYIPEVKFTDSRLYFKNADGEEFIVKMYGAKTGVRGTKEMGRRPDIAILDDLVSDEDARSPTVIASIEDTVYKAIDHAMNPMKNMLIWSGTPFNSKDPLYKAVESGSWLVNAYPVCEQFPCSREEFKGAWEDRFTYDYVRLKYEQAKRDRKLSSFYQELMLRIMSEDERLIRDSEINWYNRKLLLKNLHNYTIYITTDFAVSEKEHADFSVISVWAYGNNGDIFWIDGICKKQLLDVSINYLFEYAKLYKPLSVGIEVTGQQAGFVSWIRKEMLDRNIFFNLASENNSGTAGIRPNSNKLTRFMSMLPYFKLGKFYLPEDLRESEPIKEAMNELSLVTANGFRSKHDDFIDTISMLGMMQLIRPTADTELATNSLGRMWEEDSVDDEPGLLTSYTV